MDKEIEDLAGGINNLEIDLKDMNHRLSNDRSIIIFEIEKLNKAVNDLYVYNENLKKENKLLKEAIVSISKHTEFKNDYINKLSNEIVKENFK
ncbi:hypothetical protein UFVDC4_00005 [Staphylococcus phage vB_SauM-UFV_DC4]|nr:hypothetical protein UFVDC4_00005 [Staphylococcus phage vB_SauM-UFV_DC4]